jgi:hypothetical protein
MEVGWEWARDSSKRRSISIRHVVVSMLRQREDGSLLSNRPEQDASILGMYLRGFSKTVTTLQTAISPHGVAEVASEHARRPAHIYTARWGCHLARPGDGKVSGELRRAVAGREEADFRAADKEVSQQDWSGQRVHVEASRLDAPRSSPSGSENCGSASPSWRQIDNMGSITVRVAQP